MSQGAWRQVLTLLGGAGLAQAIALAASPLLTRLYAPEHFGVFALFASLVTLIATVATGRYELAVILPAGDGEAWQVVKLALLIALPVTALTLLAVALGGNALAEHAGDARLAVWAWLLPVAVLLTALINTLTVWANRRQAYGALAVNRVAQSGATAAASVGLGAAGWASPGLMLGSVIGQAGAAWLLVSRRPRGQGEASVATLGELAQRYRDFPRINLPHALLDAAQASVVLAMLGAAYGGAVLGWYAFALRIARTPLAMIGSSVGQVFQQRAARLAESGGDLAELSRRTTQRLLLIAAPFGVAVMWAPELFAWVFGDNWRDAGLYARVLAPWMILSLLTSPMSQLPLIVGRQGGAFAFGVVYQLAMVLPLALGWALAWPVLHTLTLQSAAASAVLLAYGVWLQRLARSGR